MIPSANQIHSRAGPAITAAAHPGDSVAGPVAQARTDIPPVEEASAASEDMQPGRAGAGYAAGAGAGAGAEPGERRRAAADCGAPQDRAVFRARVIRFLSAMYADDAAFQRALRLGTITVRAVEDGPDPEMLAERVYAIYREGVAQAGPAPRQGAEGPPASVGPDDFIAWWPK